ncbi:unnamed protein product (macronuclear) [Paramecium tetraurelia]|uniref:Prolyl 4-hydroxylase alpha subunit Fe(2+) 2OG dioxygenase domain-containing protein n=1 Tax=Paramecium tetraurelia TaxID=5888 RepID=A0D6G5_PARTE|nr:uncharacterized protein GSPATT00001673001 [Paramecium tetraurelia]CAK78632.1 unnamed protein product [Paramecium tetraurelia]|eukprot:XP_001446029.1 hypothetical protein (macronuclear) [Paramecium tetraurelia strain d4-2]
MSDQEILLVKIFRKYFLNAYKLIFSLDQKQADRFKEKNTYYYTQQHKDCHHEHKDDDRNCCGSFFAKVYIPEKERSALEQIVFEQLSKNNIRAKLPQILDYLQQRFNSIKKSGKKDNLQWDVETEVYILNEVLREGLQFYFLKEIRLEMQKEQYIDSKQQMLVATPQTWINKYPKIELNFLSADFMYDLMNTGWSVMNKFINNNDYCHALFKELDFLERDGRFEEVQTELQRDDKTFWLTLSQMDKDSFKNLYFISHILSALPYELNSKNKDLLVQISESYQISFFGGKDKKHKKHFDSSFDKKADTGKKFTFLYVVNPVTIEIEEQKITLQPDNIVGLMSRKIPYALQSNDGRAFLIRYFIDGPVTNIC